MFFQRIYYICFRFLFPVLFSLLFLVCAYCFGVYCFGSCFYSAAHAPRDVPGHTFSLFFLSLVCLFPAFLALSDGSGHTFFSPFSFWYAFFLLFLRFRMARGILFSHLSLSGMPFACFSHSFGCSGAYFSLFFHSLVCLFLAFHALSNVLGHTFSFSFISGMSILQFLKHMLK